MKSIRQIALTAMLTIGAFTAITYTSCNKDECKDVTCAHSGTCADGVCTCPTGYNGTTCETEVRSTYANIYRGNGSDNSGESYTNWAIQFAPVSADPTAMTLTVMDDNNAPQLSFTVNLTSNTGFTVAQKTSGTFSYTGSGTVNESTATLTLTETSVAGTNTTVYTFNNMNKQ